jgi:hypothetical protein
VAAGRRESRQQAVVEDGVPRLAQVDVGIARRPGRLLPRRQRHLAGDLLELEVDVEVLLRPVLEILEDGGQEVIFEPLLVIAVRGPEPDAARNDAQALDRLQPKIAVRRFDLRLYRTDCFAPQLNHVFHR